MTPAQGTRWIIFRWWLPIVWNVVCRATLCRVGLHGWDDNGVGHRPTCRHCD